MRRLQRLRARLLLAGSMPLPALSCPALTGWPAMCCRERDISPEPVSSAQKEEPGGGPWGPGGFHGPEGGGFGGQDGGQGGFGGGEGLWQGEAWRGPGA